MHVVGLRSAKSTVYVQRSESILGVAFNIFLDAFRDPRTRVPSAASAVQLISSLKCIHDMGPCGEDTLPTS